MLNGKAFFHRYKSKAVVTISATVWKDSAWPFNNGDDLVATIDGERVVLSKQIKGQRSLLEEHVPP